MENTHKLIRDYLNSDVQITLNWGVPVLNRDKESWTADTKKEFNNLTPEDVETTLKWCNFKGTDEEAVIAAIKSLITPEDLPLNCSCDINFKKEAKCL